MKAFIFVFFALTAHAQFEEHSSILMFSFQEVGPLRQSQKNFYIKRSIPEINRLLPDLNLTQQRFENILFSEHEWNELEQRIESACQNPQATRACRRLAKARIDALELGSAHPSSKHVARP